MNKTLRIGILHYHLHHGGVYTVMTNALFALIAHGGYDNLEIDLMTSDACQGNGKNLIEKLTEWARHHGPNQLQVNQVEIPELAYNANQAHNKQHLFDQAQSICRHILQAMDLQRNNFQFPYVLHTHNVNLGRNPYLTLAQKLLIETLDREKLPAHVLYQIHDFAEDNRKNCWKAMLECSGKQEMTLAVEMMYPKSERLTYVCINSYDQKTLLKMGFQADKVLVLPNTVNTSLFSQTSIIDMNQEQLAQLKCPLIDFQADLKSRISDFSKRYGYHFDPRRKILLSPVKAIRRKNITESILLLLKLNSLEDQYQLLITLAPDSPDDLKDYQAIEQVVKKYKLPVVMGLGAELLPGGHQRVIKNSHVESYGLIDLMTISHAVVTTSVQEGFGYVFHEAWLADKMVIGRNIADLTCDFKKQGLSLDHLYDHLLIPAEWVKGQWDEICHDYFLKLDQLRKLFGRPEMDIQSTIKSIDQIKSFYIDHQEISHDDPSRAGEKMIDWADLPIGTRLLLLEQLASNAIGKSEVNDQILPINQKMRMVDKWFPDDGTPIIHQNKQVVTASYNMSTIARQLSMIIDAGSDWLRESGGRKTISSHFEKNPKEISNDPVVQRSLDIKKIRLLV
ncbi:MAG: hypothetical protein K9M57_05110 [Phycisphaerae bacterium]|nr:hypothetical protein [Phycisphaerae bacterium]